jgi:hypothetical protein
MPCQGERWFKGMALDSAFFHDYFKPEYQDDNISKGVPRSHMTKYFDKMLRVIQRYFTCEGHFNMVYQYHIRLLMHFTGKQLLNFPFYLFRSLGKMSDKVQAKSKLVESSIFHSGLIKFLVLEELSKTSGDWDTFLSTSGFSAYIISTPQTKRKTLSSTEKVVQTTSGKIKSQRGKIVDQD